MTTTAPQVPAGPGAAGPPSASAGVAPLPGRRLVETAAVVVIGAAGAWLVGRDGSLPWQVLRVVVAVAATAAAWRAVRRCSARACGWLGVGAGLSGTSVGLGIGLPSVLAGAPLAAVAGTACLLAGLVLLAAGSARLVATVSGWRRPVVVMVLLVVTAAVVLPTGQAVAATNVPRHALGTSTPADLGLTYRDVRFRATDGVLLSGWYLPSRTGAAVALLHGAGSTRSAVLPHAAVLARHGYGVLLYDARGHGRSQGRAMELGWAGDRDVPGAVSFLRARPDVDATKVAVVGLSMGGEQAIGAAAADARVRAVVAEGATGRVAADHAWLSDRHGWRGAVTERWNAVLEFGLADLLTSLHPPVTLRDAVARTAPRPVLLVTAEEVDAEQQAARYIRSAAPATVQVWRVPGVGHTQGLARHPGAWTTRVVGFLDRALGVRRP